VFDFEQPLLIAGLVMGLASSLHCLGMCSGIATSLCFAAASAPGDPKRNLYWSNLLINAGRFTGYMVAGTLVGAIGSTVFGALDRSFIHLVLRWAAAVSLGWIGLSMIGFLPVPTAFYRVAGLISDGLAAITHRFHLPSAAALFVAGCAWGFFPCAMVYAALFYAMLSGSWLNGAIAMLGFGLGTLLPVMAAGLGLPLLSRRAQSGWMRTTAGLAIVLLGIASVMAPPATIAEWCGIG
jgi:sulfite exporter TauE/SafE